MTLPLTPAMLAAAYDYLRTTPPFRRWGLPDSDDIAFRVLRTPRIYGQHTRYRRLNEHVIDISSGNVGRTQTLMEVMAHEMIHLHQAVRKSLTANTEHNAEFRRLAARVCRYHGFDPKVF